ncbi:hypothetical protein [Magnetovibrio sp.]|uniref:hypothetical protein n=1 Tax=Magnetovibrio sp. TaxID=2024836 RepID=UPI002F91D33A
MTRAQNTPGSTSSTRPRWRVAVSVVALLFGLATIKSGGSVLFIDGADRAAAGDYVPFVLWFNFLAGFVYIVTAIGIFMWKAWSSKMAMALAALSVLVFAALGVHIAMGGAFEMRTVYAMTLRSFVWVTFAFLLLRAMRPSPHASSAPSA